MVLNVGEGDALVLLALGPGDRLAGQPLVGVAARLHLDEHERLVVDGDIGGLPGETGPVALGNGCSRCAGEPRGRLLARAPSAWLRRPRAFGSAGRRFLDPSFALRLGADADLGFFSLIAGRSNTPASLLAAIRCAPFLSMEHTLVEHLTVKMTRECPVSFLAPTALASQQRRTASHRRRKIPRTDRALLGGEGAETAPVDGTKPPRGWPAIWPSGRTPCSTRSRSRGTARHRPPSHDRATLATSDAAAMEAHFPSPFTTFTSRGSRCSGLPSENDVHRNALGLHLGDGGGKGPDAKPPSCPSVDIGRLHVLPSARARRRLLGDGLAVLRPHLLGVVEPGDGVVRVQRRPPTAKRPRQGPRPTSSSPMTTDPPRSRRLPLESVHPREPPSSAASASSGGAPPPTAARTPLRVSAWRHRSNTAKAAESASALPSDLGDGQINRLGLLPPAKNTKKGPEGALANTKR